MGTAAAIGDQKAQLRAHLSGLRRSLSTRQRREKSVRILDTCRSRPPVVKADPLCCYLSFDGEVETRPLVTKLIAAGRRVAVPVFVPETGELVFSLLSDWGHLHPGPFGILEPRPEKIRGIAAPSLPLFIVPGIGFDHCGRRLGYGFGCYDRALAGAAPDARLIGLAYDAQIVDEIPHGSHDVPMHEIITETRVITAVPQGGAAGGGVPNRA